MEYNQLDPLLRATGHPDGDVNCDTGYSPFPGNINQVFLWLNIMYHINYLHWMDCSLFNPKPFACPFLLHDQSYVLILLLISYDTNYGFNTWSLSFSRFIFLISWSYIYSPVFHLVLSQLILELGSYIEELSKTGGAIKEFVNPK